MALGKLGARGGFGGLGALKGGGGGGSKPTAPVLAFVSVTGSSAAFTIDIDDTIGVGDLVTLQTQATGGDWSSATTTTHTITSGEDGANEVDLSLSMAAGTYDARVRVAKAATPSSPSDWSNVYVGFTITASDDDDYAAWLAAA